MHCSDGFDAPLCVMSPAADPWRKVGVGDGWGGGWGEGRHPVCTDDPERSWVSNGWDPQGRWWAAG